MALTGEHDRGGDQPLPPSSYARKAAVLAVLLPAIPLAVWAFAWLSQAISDIGSPMG